MRIKGRSWVFGDNLDTDTIISGKYLTMRDPDLMAEHVLESLSPGFAKQVTKGDLIVAGRNFGCGSSREEAPVVLKTLGISIVIASGFARLFFRNAINIGLPVLECKDHNGISNGDLVEADLENGALVNVTKGQVFQASKMPEFLLRILNAGGALEAYRLKLSQTVKK